MTRCLKALEQTGSIDPVCRVHCTPGIPVPAPSLPPFLSLSPLSFSLFDARHGAFTLWKPASRPDTLCQNSLARPSFVPASRSKKDSKEILIGCSDVQVKMCRRRGARTFDIFGLRQNGNPPSKDSFAQHILTVWKN